MSKQALVSREGGNMSQTRCSWATTELGIAYHDEEWGVPVHDDRRLFEFLILEGAQAGLSWETILKKRARYRLAFDHFDPVIVAGYGKRKIDLLLADAGIIRNRLKIGAAVQNAKAFLAVQAEFGSFDTYAWRFVDGRPRLNHRRSSKDVPASTPESDALSKDLKNRAFTCLGTTIVSPSMPPLSLGNNLLLPPCPHHA